MNDVKWIKLTVNVFDDEKFDAIRTLPDGNDIQLVWVKLLCLAGTCNESGFLMLTREIPYTDEMLASRFHMDTGVVQRAMMLFQKLEMVEVVDNIYMVSNWLKYQSGERLDEIKEKHRQAQKRYRERQRLSCNNKNGDITSDVTRDVTSDVTPSYSLISNSNLNNLNYLVNESKYKDSSYLLNNSLLLESIREWMDYKDNKKPRTQHHYDTEMGISKLLTRIINADKENGTDYVIECINNSIANNYQGIVFSERTQRKSKGVDTSVIDNWGRT